MDKTVASLEDIIQAEPGISTKEIHRQTGWNRSWIRNTRRYYINRTPLDPIDDKRHFKGNMDIREGF